MSAEKSPGPAGTTKMFVNVTMRKTEHVETEVQNIILISLTRSLALKWFWDHRPIVQL